MSLFVASPLIAPLMMLGWGASVGGFIGAADIHKKGPFSVAREIIQAAVGADNDSGPA